MSDSTPRWLACAGLLTLALLLADPGQVTTLIPVVPLVMAALAAGLSWRRWAISAAVMMLPYFCYGVMEILTNPARRTRAMAFTALTISVLLAAFDANRRRRGPSTARLEH
jgi:uncharacterized membrane protein